MASPSDPQRYDDRLSTMLAIDAGTSGGAAALWQQLADMLAQAGAEMAPPLAARALTALSLVRADVALPVRLRTARAVADRCRFAPLAVLFAGDSPAVVTAFFDRLTLNDATWMDVIPAIGPLARSRLRLRGDGLAAPVRQALAQFGAIDFSLPNSAGASALAVPGNDTAPVATPDVADGATSIAGLVQRIEQWRHRRDTSAPVDPDGSAHPRVRLLIDSDGIVRAVDGLPRAAVCGLSIAEPARPLETGVDAGIARAFAKRDHVASGRLWISAGMPWSGCWALTASPQFDDIDGRFVGYVADMAPMTDETAAMAEPPRAPADNALAEAMRQMMHELRSPLNAVSGFAQLIQGQYFGPVADGYRTLAKSIESDAASLMRVFEDLDDAARLDLGSAQVVGESIDLIAMLRSLIDGDDRFRLDHHPAEIFVTASTSAVHSLFARLFRVAQRAPHPSLWTIDVDVASNGHAAITFNGGFGDGDEDGDAMGHGFSRRIAAQLASRLGGTLAFTGGKALLNLPCATLGQERFGSR